MRHPPPFSWKERSCGVTCPTGPPEPPSRSSGRWCGGDGSVLRHRPAELPEASLQFLS